MLVGACLDRLPIAVRGKLSSFRPLVIRWDVMRSGVSALGCVLPEKDDHSAAGARDIADRLIANLGFDAIAPSRTFARAKNMFSNLDWYSAVST